jgi:hypothetical protein
MEIKIRTLTVGDRIKLTGMIKNMAENFGHEYLLNAISPNPDIAPKETNSNPATEYGIRIVRMLLETLQSEIHAWLADLIGKTYEEFCCMPIDTEIEVLKQISEAPEVERFFTSASQLSKKTKSFQSLLKGTSAK